MSGRTSPRRTTLLEAARAQGGFTMIELIVAMFVIATGLMAVVGTLDASTKLVTISEGKDVASHVAQREIEQIQSLDYDEIQLTAAPLRVPDPADPSYHVTTGTEPTYDFDQKSGSASETGPEPLVIDAVAGRVESQPTTWQDGRYSGKVHRYVTWVDDRECGPNPATTCPGPTDYRRIVVAVTREGENGIVGEPAIAMSLAADPDSVPEGAVVDGVLNPLLDPETRCLDSSGQLVECVGSLGTEASKTWYLYDTPASHSVRQEVTASHPSHPTWAPFGDCTTGLTSGCPVPDLMGESPPPSEDTVPPPLHNYSNELTGGAYEGGRAIRRDTPCATAPSSSDNTKSAFWVSTGLETSETLTGDGGLTLYTQTVGGVAAELTLCVRVYDVPASLANLVATPPTLLGSASYDRAQWPQTPTPLSFSFDFRGGDGPVTIPAGRRIGVRVWVADGSGSDVALVYDHPSYGSAFQLNMLGEGS